MHIHLDPVGGLAGDMFVAAMLDAFPPLEPAVQSAVRAAGLPERFRCDLVAHADHALNGKRFLVLESARPHDAEPSHAHAHRHVHEHTPDRDHGHRPFAEVRAALGASPLDSGVRDRALAIFTLLAEAEARVHGATPDTVSFHELGEWDSIADIVAAAAIIDSLGPATWSGFVKSAHGRLPVPAPATALLLRGLRVTDDGIGGERVTPTGAAIARYVSSLEGAAPRDRKMTGTGFGFGTRVLPGTPNCVRALVFDTVASGPNPSEDRVISIEFEVDDQTPEDLAIGLDHIRAHPLVLDVLQTPAIGKKGRLVVSARVLCRPEAADEVAALCFEETTTLGVRLLEVRRRILARSASEVNIGAQALSRKHAERGSRTTTKVEASSLRLVRGYAERERLRRAADDGRDGA
jgi:uncharacterized protein (TIGR00299 family) protein